MRIALVCIAKNEDRYIDEWVNYHLKLGFDNIFIYQNNWRCSLENPKVIKLIADGECQQVPSYNHFIQNNIGKYDWVAFLDVDEFLVLKTDTNVSGFIEGITNSFSNVKGIGINWVYFGDNDLKDDGSNGVLKRFTKRDLRDQHVKSIIRLSRDAIMYIHNPDSELIDTDGKRFSGPFNFGPINKAQINHYFFKTREEFRFKVNRGRADMLEKRKETEFKPLNFGYDDFNARDFMDKI